MKKILFPTDFSVAAEHAFVYALQVAKAIGASVTTLHVYKLPDVRGVNLPNTLRTIYNDIELEAFENYRDEVPHLREIAERNGLEKVEMQHLMKQGEVVPTIIKTATQEDVDLIVMGTKGASGLKEVFMGSIATKVLDKLEDRPVLAIPENAVFDGRIDKIAVTTDYKNDEINAIRYLIYFAQFFNAELHCLHVDVNHTEFFTDNMSSFKRTFNRESNIHFEVLDGNYLEEAIEEWMKENNGDILAMLTHKRSGWQAFFNKSNTKQMVYHSEKPILAIPASVFSFNEV